MRQSSVLIISDDHEFARALRARWQAERSVPAITVVGSDVCDRADLSGYELVIVGPVRSGQAAEILRTLLPATPLALYVSRDGKPPALPGGEHPRVLVIPQQDGWMNTLILVSGEAIKRLEALERARQAERGAAAQQRHATLGRFMLDMRHSLNNALTSVIGNADLLLLEPGQLPAEAREQVRTMHTMALRLHEIMQRFSSLASELQLIEKESQAETERASSPAVPRS